MRIVDISQGWSEGMAKFEAAWYPEFRLERVMTPATDPVGVDRTFTLLHVFPHNGTHVETSFHFNPTGERLDSCPLSAFVGWSVIANLSHLQDLEPITSEVLEAAVDARLSPGERLLIRTDHPVRHLGRHDYWDTPPFLAPSAADWIIANGVSTVGMDCITERPGDREFPIHRRLLGAGVAILENLANLDQLASDRVWLFAAPIKVADVEAAPVRAVVVEGLTEGEPTLDVPR